MRRRGRDLFTTVRTEGGLLPPDLLARISAGDRDLEGLTPEAYSLAPNERLAEAASRAWTRLAAVWPAFREAAAKLPDRDTGTSATRDRWLLVLFHELGYGRLTPAHGIETDGKRYPISHLWNRTPIHLVGCRVGLDHRTPGVAGAATASPHGLVQELLNRSDRHLWGFVSNGMTLRILRDNASLTRQAYVEFDLAGMMEGEVYSDFVLLWLVAHATRVEGERPEECRLEQWARDARDRGLRALETLRDGVEEAIVALGQGFLAHPANGDLRDRLRSGALSKDDYYRQLLRLVYRLIFLFVAEDRDLLLHPGAGGAERSRYRAYYSAGRLRRLAERHRGTRHPDLYRGLRLVMRALGSDEGCPPLGLPPLGSFLWSPEAAPDLAEAEIANAGLLAAVRSLVFTTDGGVLRAVDYRNLGSEELGSVYESLLELHPEIEADAGAFTLATASGHERKTTGSYYTPESLIQCLLDTALDPVLDEAAASADPAAAILALKVCDPACGSGHFLIAAAHRMARRLASARTGDEEPAPDAVRTALRDVIGRCLYGVDLNPMAVELCKVGLWMEALDPGKPLSFLDHHIRAGNSLLGATLELIAAALPDDTFKPLEGDSREACAFLKKRNRAAREGLGPLFTEQDTHTQTHLQQAAASLEELPDDRAADVHAKETAFRRYEQTDAYRHKKHLADTWCAAFVIRKHFREPGRESSAFGITQDHLYGLASGRMLPAELGAEVERLSRQYEFFHWHLVFLEVLAKGGFDCVLGNPPWVSYTGRQQAEVTDRFLRLLLKRFPCVARWPASHPAFVLLSTQLLTEGGRAGLVLPKQVADLAAYGGVRQEVTAIARLASPVVDAGEDSFPGVTQPVGLFSIIAARDGTVRSQAPWPLANALSNRREPKQYSAVISKVPGLPDLPALLAERPRFMPKTFADPGVHTGNVSKKIILDSRPMESPEYEPIREGRDIAAFVCRPSRKWLWTMPILAEGEYCTIRPPQRYRGVPILVRQTANRPIAARHRSPAHFRNSLLACLGVPGVPDTVVVGFLNSALYAWLHRAAAQDANQKAFPQVKVRHLHSLPAIPVDAISRSVADRPIRDAIDAAVLEAEAGAMPGVAPHPDLLEFIERMVLAAFGLSPDLAPALLEAVK